MPEFTETQNPPSPEAEEDIQVIAETEEERQEAALAAYQELLDLRLELPRLPARGHQTAEKHARAIQLAAEIKALGYSEEQLAKLLAEQAPAEHPAPPAEAAPQ